MQFSSLFHRLPFHVQRLARIPLEISFDFKKNSAQSPYTKYLTYITAKLRNETTNSQIA